MKIFLWIISCVLNENETRKNPPSICPLGVFFFLFLKTRLPTDRPTDWLTRFIIDLSTLFFLIHISLLPTSLEATDPTVPTVSTSFDNDGYNQPDKSPTATGIPFFFFFLFSVFCYQFLVNYIFSMGATFVVSSYYTRQSSQGDWP